MRVAPLASAVALAALVTACSSTDAANAVEVVSSKDECRPAKTTLDAGKVTFKIKNDAGEVTELYVLGQRDKVVSELENIGPGVTRSLTVSLKAGHYVLNCKPGMKGEGIRTPIEVTGAGGEKSASAGDERYDRAIDVTSVDHAFQGEVDDVKVGEAIEFKLKNAGQEAHEFEVLLPDGKALGEVGPTPPGTTGEAVLKFEKPGTYTYVCGIDDHEQKGMKGTFEVVES